MWGEEEGGPATVRADFVSPPLQNFAEPLILQAEGPKEISFPLLPSLKKALLSPFKCRIGKVDALAGFFPLQLPPGSICSF